MKFSFNWIQSFFNKKLPEPKKLADLITLYAFEVEKIEKFDRDFILDINVLPNRGPDCFSHLGIVRELAAILNLKIVEQKPKLIEDKENKAQDFIKITVSEKSACQRYTARVILDVKVQPSPDFIQERLKTCGLRPINNIVDISNYVMLETGQPLHAFDLEKISDRKIIVRKSKGREKIITLDEEKYDLDKDILIIADSKSPLAIAGIKGGKKAEIEQKTKKVVIEAANFNQKIIRQASKKIDLKTDASWRFEHGLDPNLTTEAADLAAALIQEFAGGKICQGFVDFYPKKVLPKKIILDLAFVEKLIGLNIPQVKIKNILNKLQFGVKERGVGKLEIKVPTFRLDVSFPEDLVEEIVRIYGYQKVPARLPMATLIPPEKNLDIIWEYRTKNILKEAGFSEVLNYSFLSKEDIDNFGLSQPKLGILEIENPTSADFQYLRPSLITNLLKDVKKNQKNFKEIKIFELGKIYKYQNSKTVEKRRLTGLATGDHFYYLKGIIDLLLNSLGISNIWYKECKPTPEESKISIWNKKKCAEIKIDQEEIGFLGELSAKILDNLKIEQKVVMFDIDFEKLIKLTNEEQEYQIISTFPAATRDIAVLVPKFTKVEEVLNKIEIAGGEIIRDIDLFDIYEGEALPEGKKNLAFHIIYQAKDKTLSSKEIEEIQNKIIENLEKEPDWQVRK